MTVRCLDAAALTVALAGADGESVAAAFDPTARDHLAGAVRRLRVSGTRLARARGLAAAGVRLLGGLPSIIKNPDEVGARFLAAWVRSLGAADRNGFIRQLGAGAIAALRGALPSAPTFDAAQRSTATLLMKLVHRALGRPPTLSEWSSLLEALALRGSLADPDLLRAARVVRMSASAGPCFALAVELCAR